MSDGIGRVILVSMQAFIDESESPGRQFVFAGFIGDSEQWGAFSDRWKATLRQPPDIHLFKFHQFVHRAGAFSASRLSDAALKRRMADLVATMARARFIRISVSIGLPAFAEMARTELSGLALAYPYCYAFQLITVAIALELLKRGHRGSCDIIFDEHLTFGPKAARWYPLIRELCVTDEVRSILPSAPIFRRDDETMALQAADLYAGLVRSGGGERNGPGDEYLSRLLVALSEARVVHAADMRAQAELARVAWDGAIGSLGDVSGTAAAFARIATRLQKSLRDIGGDSVAEHALAPVFAAVSNIGSASDPDGLDWLRQEVAEVTLLSTYSQCFLEKTTQQALDEAMQRYGITPDQLRSNSGRVAKPPVTVPEAQLTRAIALLDEPSIESFRQGVARKRARNAAKAARRTSRSS